MKILQVHNKYREAGGEDVVADQEARMLSGQHAVDRWIRDNTIELKSLSKRLRIPFTVHYSASSRREAEKKLKNNKHGYDLMHVHNFFPLFSPSVFDAARKTNVPSVMTLHNYRLIHPNGLLFSNGQIDERSIRGSAWECVRDGVYRNSVLQTAVVARMIEYHRKKRTWDRVPTLFIALTEFAKKKMAEGGLPEDRIVVKPNFVEDPGPELADRRLNGFSRGTTSSTRFLYVGRISKEKGVADLVDSWIKHDIKEELRIVGDGPERIPLQDRSAGNHRIHWLGRLNRDQVQKEMAEATALLFPSRWYEGFPMTLVEAFSVGCPAIVTNIGSQAEIVLNRKFGLHVTPGNHEQIAYAVHRMAGEHSLARRLSENVRRAYRNRYTPEVNYRRLMEIYEKAVKLEKRF